MSLKILLFILLYNLLLGVSFASEKVIVVINSYPQGEWQNGITKGLEENIKIPNFKFKLVNLLYDYETLKFKDREKQDQRVHEIVEVIRNVSPNYILINDDEAIEKVLPALSQYKNIILNGMNDRPEHLNWGKTNRITDRCGIIEYYPITQSLNMISMMAPSVKSMSILSSNGDSSKIVAKIFRDLSTSQLQNIQLRKISLEANWNVWKRELLEMNKKDGLGWILVPYEIVDNAGNRVSLDTMAKWIRANVKIPLLGILSIHTKMGFLSAISVDPYGLGKQAAEIVVRIENGEKCGNIGFEKSKYHNFEINVSELKRLNYKVPDAFIGVAKFINSHEAPIR